MTTTTARPQRVPAGAGRLRVASLNTDGIRRDGSELGRAAAAVAQLVAACPDVILLQEVTDETLEGVFNRLLPAHGFVAAFEKGDAAASAAAAAAAMSLLLGGGDGGFGGYFCAVFVSRSLTVVPGSVRTRSFSEHGARSDMGRALHSVAVTGGKLGAAEVEVFTAHLESGNAKTPAKTTRILQWHETCGHLLRSPRPAIFGGDTNLRQGEVETPGESASAYAAARSSGGGGQEAAKKEGKRRFNEYFRRKSRSDKAKLVEAIAVVEAFDVCGEPIRDQSEAATGVEVEAARYSWDLFRNNHREIKPNSNFGTRGWQIRFDRFFYRNDHPTAAEATANGRFGVVPGSLRLICADPIELDGYSKGSPYFPSDHFGICCDWQVAHPTGGAGGAGGGRGGGGGNGGSSRSSSSSSSNAAAAAEDSDDSF